MPNVDCWMAECTAPPCLCSDMQVEELPQVYKVADHHGSGKGI